MSAIKWLEGNRIQIAPPKKPLLMSYLSFILKIGTTV